MSLSIYTYSNPYEINNEPYWDSIRNCAHFCVSQTMVNGLSAVYDELDNGQLATVEELVEALYPGWFDTKTYIEQYTILTNTLDKVTPNIEPDRWKKIKQSLRFNKSALLDSIRLMAEMGLLLKNIKIKKITEEQMYLVATYNAILRGEDAKIFDLKKNFSESEIDNAVKTALVAKDKRRGKEVKAIESVDCNTVVIHGIHQFTPTILSMHPPIPHARKPESFQKRLPDEPTLRTTICYEEIYPANHSVLLFPIQSYSPTHTGKSFLTPEKFHPLYS